MDRRHVKLIGVDCAVDHRNVGVAIGTVANHRLEFLEAVSPMSYQQLVDILAAQCRSTRAVMLALDAPLGWPGDLGKALSDHRAGEPHELNAHRMFRRVTDDVVYTSLKKRSLDVGADRIARTAHAALRLLADVRAQTRLPIPLAWTPTKSEGVAALEVYPAATLASRDWSRVAYKRKGDEGKRSRRALLRRLADEGAFSVDFAARVTASDHLFDAALCVLAAADFMRGDVIRPTDEELVSAEQEGWIWARPHPARGRQ